MKEYSKKQGLQIEEMYNMSEDQSTNLDYVKNKTLEIKALVELQKEIIEREGDAPIVKSWLESGGVEYLEEPKAQEALEGPEESKESEESIVPEVPEVPEE